MESSDGEQDVDVMLDKHATLGLNKKDTSRQPKQVVLEDLSARQLAASVSGVFSYVLPSDMSDLGGEYVICLHVRYC